MSPPARASAWSSTLHGHLRLAACRTDGTGNSRSSGAGDDPAWRLRVSFRWRLLIFLQSRARTFARRGTAHKCRRAPPFEACTKSHGAVTLTSVGARPQVEADTRVRSSSWGLPASRASRGSSRPAPTQVRVECTQDRARLQRERARTCAHVVGKLGRVRPKLDKLPNEPLWSARRVCVESAPSSARYVPATGPLRAR